MGRKEQRRYNCLFVPQTHPHFHFWTHRPSGRVDRVPTSHQLCSSCTQTLMTDSKFSHSTTVNIVTILTNTSVVCLIPDVFQSVFRQVWVPVVDTDIQQNIKFSYFLRQIDHITCKIPVYSEWKFHTFVVLCHEPHWKNSSFPHCQAWHTLLSISSFGWRLTNISFLALSCSISALIQKHLMLFCPHSSLPNL